MLSKKRKAARLTGKYQALKFAATICNTSGHIVPSFLANRYASDMAKEEFRNELLNLSLKLHTEADIVYEKYVKLQYDYNGIGE